MIKFNMSMIREAKRLFPDMTVLHEMMQRGDAKALDMVYAKLGFTVDEDDIVRAFRNKKEQKLLDMANRAKDIRELYQKMYMMIESQENKMADKMGYQDCM